MKRQKRYVVDYYFNEHKHWAEVYNSYNEMTQIMREIMKKYKLYKVEVFEIDSI